MKITKIRLLNFRSIKDSGVFWLQKHDPITVLAGQNESGKSSILRLLHAFQTEDISEDDLRDDGSDPSIYLYCDTRDFSLSSLPDLPEITRLEKSIVKSEEVVVLKVYDRSNDVWVSGFGITTTDAVASTTESILSTEGESIHRQIFTSPFMDEIGFQNEDIAKAYIPPEFSHTDDEEGEESDLDSDEDEDYEIDEESEDGEDFDLTEEEKISVSIADIQLELIRVFRLAILAELPTIILFDDYADILPSKVTINELTEGKSSTKGINAVRNVEKILGLEFKNWESLPDHRINPQTRSASSMITADFKEFWDQELGFDNITQLHVDYYQGKGDSPYVRFFVASGTESWLPPSQRSDGFKWFLSFYLELRAKSRISDNFFILFDEPGLYLHSNAQTNMIKVLEDVGTKHQILYSTHSPYLIQSDKLNRVRLVYNNDDKGTRVEKITTSIVSRDKNLALKPIVDAMGISLGSGISAIQKDRNVIVEGISDHYYFNAFQKLLGIPLTMAYFIPSRGAPNVHLLMEVCIGWHLNWMIIFDSSGSKREINKIKKQFFPSSEDGDLPQIYVLPNCDGIEDMLTFDDFKLLDKEFDFSGISDMKGLKTKFKGQKELLARIFLEMVNTGKIKKTNISKDTIQRFQSVFDYIDNFFSP